MKFEIGVKQIILLCVALMLVGVMIVGNIVLSVYAPLIHQYFLGDTTSYDSEIAQKALSEGDKLVQELGEERMVLLRNENKALPLETSDKINLFGWNATDQGFILTGGGSGGTTIAKENKVTLTRRLTKRTCSITGNC